MESDKTAFSPHSPAPSPGDDERHRLLLSVAHTTSEQLLGAYGELKIGHNGEIYSLRKTRNGKLILTK
ncbi:MAG: hemin uptake protein HemP [Betaproteobacteria bacterium]|nr:hemin uptake protein HemP [Betaproteobacteria bacterium]